MHCCSEGRARAGTAVQSLLASTAILLCLVPAVTAQTVRTNLAVTVRHAPNLNGNGRIEGSLQQLLGENVTFNGGFTMTGDLLVPGTPTLRLNGQPAVAGTVAGTGNTAPSGYQITLNGNCSLHCLRTRTTPVSLPTVPAPPRPAGARTVAINNAGQSMGDPATLRNLTLNGNAGQVAVPPGTYGNFTANGGSGFTLGVAGATQSAIYNLQNLSLNGNSRLDVIGPVLLTVANGFSANGLVGTTNRSAWLQIQIANSGFTLNGGCTVHGSVTAPAGTVAINGNSCLIGSVQSDRFTLNGGGRVVAGLAPNQAPVANAQNLSVAEENLLNLTLTGNDPEGAPLTFQVVAPPSHGGLSGTAPRLTYAPALNYNGPDRFQFVVNDGQTNSVPAFVVITVTPENDPPVANAAALVGDEDTPLAVTLTGSDVDGDALTFRVSIPPAHGRLSGVAPDLVYLPATNYFGSDSLTFAAYDGQEDSAAALVSITVRQVNHARPPSRHSRTAKASF